MTWNSGTATDYIDLLDQLIEVATSRHLATIAINNDGTGYVAGDILGITNTGSTNTHVAQIEVLTVDGGGNITAARIYRGGAYTVDPSTTTGNAATGGTGSGATFDLTFDDTGWDLQRRTKVAVSATVGAGGSGYSNGNVLTLVGGVLGNGGVASTFTVATTSGGAVATVTLLTAGQYEIPPTNPAMTSVAPSGGTGATLNVTYADKSGDTTVVLTGDAGGSNVDPIVGIRTYQGLDESGVNTTYNWALFSATADSAVLPIHQLPNISPGFNSNGDGSLTTTSTGDGAFVPLKTSDAFDITWRFRITGRSIHVLAKVTGVSTSYDATFSIGLTNQAGVPTELPYPAYIVGTSDRPKVWYRDTNSIFGGIAELISRNNGPGFFWGPEGAWIQFRVSTLTTNTTLTPTFNAGTTSPRAVLWPLGSVTTHENTEDAIWDEAPADGFDNENITSGGVSIYRTPNTAGDLFPLFALTITQSDSATDFFRTMGEIDGVFWLHTGGTALSSDDRVVQGTDYHSVAQSGTRVQPYSFFCVRED